ncbi:hypothetical protein A3A03_01315 [Candidatus Nomurabacteria bacterium RIFCSPLOWO2_01_FULL_40_18]|uniref:SMODS and SLOG-associating 2TM effector domain-containing protein n=1 Tax=Candidatus Nomurabacteria bacterium RIFCSPLOWO2_01_FULL_40_18 TaxID=1801773 RepID=A0A1F6XI16_9BACT|nr:MAG: hypothetical protein A3A03_01315 [Candidatus Nomurabacteria bacterium RIFCSPLOWO2_01_FULL_40_18]
MKDQTSLPKETAEIYLRLEQYSDIFSDFDIRSYRERALSIDFIEEIKRAASGMDKGGIELMLHIPEKDRNEAEEATIKERLAAHFKRHYYLLSAEKRRVMKLGITMVVLGIMCMILATFVVFKDPTQNLWLSFLVVFLEPAAWFLLWEGMDQIIFNSKNVNPDLNFYKKMFYSRDRIYFKSY